ncbi:MAG TPA: hypothetical protein VFW90_00920 [Candidatus Saccharimonadales bacterium]|nr:hypothetical protein [Candidatus Saccharimonadales bacterium]
MRIFHSTRKKVAAVTAFGTAMALIPVAVAMATWGPARPTFTWAHPATYVTFNSITDNPQYGDERTFFDGTYVNNPGAAQDKLTVSDNQELSLRVYFHNNAAANLGLVATNTTVQIKLPTQATTNATAAAYIMANNANPFAVADTVDFTGARPFTLSYVPGSAQLWNNIFRGAKLSDSIVANGALVGYDKIDGRVPGCEKYSGFVTIKVRVHMAPPPVETKFACTMLDVDKIDRTRYDFTAHASVQNATVQRYNFTVKNSNGSVVDTSTVNTNALSAVYHFNQEAGTYTVSASVTTDKGTATSQNCVKQITVASPPETPPKTPPKVKASKVSVLPNTGAGDVLGIFTGASSLGAVGHYFVSRRKRGL